MAQAREKRKKKRFTSNKALMGGAVLLVGIIIGSFLGGYNVYRYVTDLLPGAGNSAASRGIVNNSRTIPNKADTTPPSAPKQPTKTTTSQPVGGQAVTTGSLKITVAPGQSNPFISTGISNLMPGESATRSFTVTNVGTDPVSSISFSVSSSGSPVLQSDVQLQLLSCSASCKVIEPYTTVNQITAPVTIWSGTLPVGQSLKFQEQTAMLQSAGSNAEGQSMNLSYGITAVGA